MSQGVVALVRALLLSIIISTQVSAITLFPAGSTWRYFPGITSPTPADESAWRRTTFSDASWQSGPAPFSYGEPAFVGTDLTGMQNSYSVVYLRRTFYVTNAANVLGLTLRAVVDDGFIVWINGRRVAAVNAPDTDAASTNGAFALSTVEPGEITDYDLGATSTYLVTGTNTIAVMVLNSALGSSDLVFDAELVSTDRITAPPTIASINPPPGAVSNLTSVTVTFSRAVTGVAAGEFLLGGVPATGMTGSGATYTFTFPQPPWGSVPISWGPLHNINDLSQPPFRFDGAAPGSTWNYELLDVVGPALASRAPAPGLTLRRLAQVEVVFNRTMTGIDAADLLLNGVPATNVTGLGAGPYRFTFAEAPAGTATVSWAANAGIISEDAEPRPFTGQPWTYTIMPNQPAPNVVINEILTENFSALRDEEGDAEDWIELYNRGGSTVNLAGWSLSVDREEEGQWVLPAITLPPGGYTYLWASGKDRVQTNGTFRSHTNFKLNPNGDTLRLFGPELPRTLVDQVEYPEQAPDYSYGRLGSGTNTVWRFFALGTPGAPNGSSTLTNKVEDVYFSVERGFYNYPFGLSLVSRTPGATILYTTNGSPPSLTNGTVYSAPILINSTRVIRAAAFATNQLPSRIRTHTYLYNVAANRRLLPVMSLVTATNNLYGRTGIMEYNPRNTQNHGAAWERPVSVEWIRPEDNGGFQTEAGIRVAGGDYIRGQYNYRSTALPQSKYSFRLYFRGEYGQGRLNYPVFPGTTLESFDTMHLRAGMNDHSNPFLKDEFVRALCDQVGIVACHGTFVHLFLNGVYKGMYNPAERVNEDFLQAYHGGGDQWDVIGAGNEVLGGDSGAWSALRTVARRDLTIRTNYVDVASRMDLENFVDYLLPHIYADNDDWPHNNTRNARERVPGSRFRFYPWDAEFAFGSHDVSYDTIANTLSTTSPPWGTTDYQQIFNALKRSYEFRLLFADRVHRSFFNGGPLTDERIRALYEPMRLRVAPSISAFQNVINTWINNRRRYVTNAFFRAGFLMSSNAPGLNQFGGRVPTGFQLVMTNLAGTIWYTTNGSDPREAFVSTISTQALAYSGPLAITRPLRLRARSLSGTNWSAVVAVDFQPAQVGIPIRFTEIMYHPPGGDEFEFVELQNIGGVPVDVSGFRFNGLNFRFPEPFPSVAAGARILLASDARTNSFLGRYPGVTVSGWFGGSLNNGGERLELLDQAGQVVTSVEYSDSEKWPRTADGGGASLENIRPESDPDNPANWQAGSAGGSPGRVNSPATSPAVRINEINAAGNTDWIELHNTGATAVNIGGWLLSDDSNPRQFAFPAGTTLGAGGYVVVHSTSSTNAGTFRSPFNLDRKGETVGLYDASTNRVDLIQYGAAPDGYTIGRNDAGLWTLCEPTPLSRNESVLTFGASTNIVLNEFVVNPDGGDDWIELHNMGTSPVALEGWTVGTTNAFARIGSPSYVAPGGFAVFTADGNPGPDHLDLKLPAAGGFVALYDRAAVEITRITYTSQPNGTALVRIPDGIGAFQTLAFSETPGASNRIAELGQTLRLAELSAWSSPDWIELDNASTNALSLAGLTLEIDPPDAPPLRAPVASSATLQPGQRLLLVCGVLPPGYSLPPGAVQFAAPLPEMGAVISLLDSRGRLVDRAEYGPQIQDRSLIRFFGTWILSSISTPGASNSAPAEFSNGSGLRINEWLTSGGTTNEFVELFNPDLLPVSLEQWVLTDDPSISGATNRMLPPASYIAANGFVRFRMSGSPANIPGAELDFRLDSLGETLRLVFPNGVVADSVDYFVQADGVSEGRYPDGAANIRRFPGTPTPGAPNRLGDVDSDGDGMPDEWEIEHGFRLDFAGDALLDADGDGMRNVDEYRAGTNPADATSRLLITATRALESALRLQFEAQAGRTYTILGSDSPDGNWSRISDIPAGVRREILVEGLSYETASRFFRIITPALP